MINNKWRSVEDATFLNSSDQRSEQSKKTSTMSSKPEEFKYLELPKSDMLAWPEPETSKEKFIRKVKENPFVPIGLGVTVFALTYGLWQMKTGNKAMSQKMMRLRVAAQGFTVFALVGGVFYSSYKKRAESQLQQQLREMSGPK